jgi:hypothetical protein
MSDQDGADLGGADARFETEVSLAPPVAILLADIRVT